MRKAKEEAAKENQEELEMQKEMEEEATYQELLLKYKAEFGLISEEELEAIQKEKKKKQR